MLPSSNPVAATNVPPRSAKDFFGDGLEPAIRENRFRRAGRTRRIDRTDATAQILDLAVRRSIDVCNGDAVVGRHQTVAGIDELGLIGLLAAKELRHRG